MNPMAKALSSDAVSTDSRDGPAQPVAWHTLPPAEAFERLQSDASIGLTQSEATQRLVRFGPNVLAPAHQRSTWSIFLAQFQSLIVVLLVAATVIALALGEQFEAVAILIVIVLNAAIGFFTEWKADRALAALKQ